MADFVVSQFGCYTTLWDVTRADLEYVCFVAPPA